MRTLTVSQLTALLDDQVAREPGGAVAFDGDGTLWSGDIGEDLFNALLDGGAVSTEASHALAVEAESHGVASTGNGVTVARRIHAAYVAGVFPEERVCELMTWVFAGWSVEEADAFAERVLTNVGLERRLHAEAMAIVTWARERGVETFLVSASPRVVVEQAARRVGFDLTNVAAATERRDADGKIQSSVVRPIPYGQGKVTHLRAKLGGRPLYAAFGDNAFDIPMLREARLPMAIRPKPRLVERAAEVTDLSVLARL